MKDTSENEGIGAPSSRRTLRIDATKQAFTVPGEATLLFFCAFANTFATLRKTTKPSTYVEGLLCDPVGTRTQGPYIKSVLLYQLSYEISHRSLERDAKI
jgi:hypothetical protein